MGLTSLADELLVGICASLDERADLRHVALAGHHRLKFASNIELYRHVSVADRSAVQLLRTLKEQAHLAALVHGIDYLIGETLCLASEADTPISAVFETFAELLPLLINVRELRLDLQMAPVLPYQLLFAPLSLLKSLNKVAIVGDINMLPMDRLAPVLHDWSSTLGRLELRGATCWPLFVTSLVLPPLPMLTELRLFTPRITDSILLALTGTAGLHTFLLDCEDDDDFTEANELDSSTPTDEGIVAVLERHGGTLRDVTIRRGRLEPEQEDRRLGLAVAEQCVGLERLELVGQNSYSDLLMRGSVHVEELNLRFGPVPAYEDVVEAIRSGCWPSLKRLDVHHPGFAEDPDVRGAILAIRRGSLQLSGLTQEVLRKGIQMSAGAVFRCVRLLFYLKAQAIPLAKRPPNALWEAAQATDIRMLPLLISPKSAHPPSADPAASLS